MTLRRPPVRRQPWAMGDEEKKEPECIICFGTDLDETDIAASAARKCGNEPLVAINAQATPAVISLEHAGVGDVCRVVCRQIDEKSSPLAAEKRRYHPVLPGLRMPSAGHVGIH